jgi:AcrR family transcriptional regulator
MTNPPGLRERKKARTRWAIQEHALRLFAEQGYEKTTVDQIAAAAEVSPSTFFRYFPTKEDVVIQDEFDDLFVEAFRQAGAAPEPLEALRRAALDVVTGIDAVEVAKGIQRAQLILREPALRARSMDNALTGFDDACHAFAEGLGRTADDLGVQVFVGACIGAFLPLLHHWVAAGGTTELRTIVERAIASAQALVVSPR